MIARPRRPAVGRTARLATTAAVALLTSLGARGDAEAQRAISGDLTTESFTGFVGAGFAASPGAGQLDADDWRVAGTSEVAAPVFGTTYDTGDLARGASAGGETTGGVYGFDVDGTGGV